MATNAQRAHLEALMRFLIAHEPLVDYSQARPFPTHGLYERDLVEKFAANQHVRMDCSGAVTELCRWAGLRDPNGAGHNGTGYTGTMLEHLPHYTDPRRARVGAIVVLGPGTGEHACMVLEPGADPLLFSHGQNAGPIAIRLSQERRYHKPPVTFLDIGKL